VFSWPLEVQLLGGLAFLVGLAVWVCLQELLQVNQDILKETREQVGWLQRIADRCDKTSNKAAMLERRFEALVSSEEDTIRHVHQVVEGYKVSVGGVAQLKEWILAEKATWFQARRRWKEDATEAAWNRVMAGARASLQDEIECEMMEDRHTGGQNKDFLEEKFEAIRLFKEMWLKGMFADEGA